MNTTAGETAPLPTTGVDGERRSWLSGGVAAFSAAVVSTALTRPRQALARARLSAAAAQATPLVPAPYLPRKGKYLERLTWKEAEVALQQAPAILLPLGARTKEHGLHLPLNNDWIMAEYFARRALDELPLVALPTLQYGYYPAFTEYAGSVNVGKETFRDLVADVCRSICRHHGPKKIYVLNTGMSTVRGLEPARQLLAAEGITMEYARFGEGDTAAVKALIRQPEGSHADEIETSMMLYIAPEIVRMRYAQRDIHPDPVGGSKGLTLDARSTTGTYSPTGAWGDPTLATREKGRVIVEARVQWMLDELKRFAGNRYAAAEARAKWL